MPQQIQQLIKVFQDAAERRDTNLMADTAYSILEMKPDWLPALTMAARAALIQKDLSKAQALVERAAAQAQSPSVLLLRAQVYFAMGEFDKASTDAELAVQQSEAKNADFDQAGSVLSACGRHQKAYDVFTRWLKRDPKSTKALFNRAATGRFLGSFESAESDYNELISLQPDDTEAIHNRSQLRRQTQERNHIDQLTSSLKRLDAANWPGRVQLLYAIAKEYEDLEKFELSWAHLDQGARLRRKYLRYDVEADVDTMLEISRVFDKGFFSEFRNGYSCKRPIFVLGLPRSGTTLVERILASHPKVASAGELQAFAEAIVSLTSKTPSAKTIPKQALVKESSNLNFEKVGQYYVEHTQRHVSESEHLIDKMPNNFLYCGLIATALPKARIIHVKRHPMANGYGLYKALFKQGYPFSYDLEDIARYILAYRSLMAHWKAVIPDQIYDIQYEHVIADQEGTTRQLVAACNLPWDDNCLRFDRNTAPSMTHSAVQVRGPINKSAADLWRNYYEELAPLRRLLIEGGVPEDELS